MSPLSDCLDAQRQPLFPAVERAFVGQQLLELRREQLELAERGAFACELKARLVLPAGGQRPVRPFLRTLCALPQAPDLVFQPGASRRQHDQLAPDAPQRLLLPAPVELGLRPVQMLVICVWSFEKPARERRQP